MLPLSTSHVCLLTSPRLTKLVADVESIIDMRTAGDRRLFVALPNMKEVIYEFECINKDGDIMFVNTLR